MDSKLLESYLDNIGELVLDEDKIITYKSLSKILGIHVNTAKHSTNDARSCWQNLWKKKCFYSRHGVIAKAKMLLYTYLSKQKTESSPPISATYLLAGKLVDGSFNVTVVNESDLKSTYKKFVEITSEHVYSIQKGKTVKDIQVLTGIGNDIQNIKSSDTVIKCVKSVIKVKKDKIQINEPVNKKDAAKFQTKSNLIEVKKEKETIKPEVPKKVESPKKSENTSNETLKKSSPQKNKSKADAEKTQGASKKQKGNIANFFANVATKNVEKSSNIQKNKSNNKVENKSSPVAENKISPVKNNTSPVVKNNTSPIANKNVTSKTKNKDTVKSNFKKRDEESPKKKKKGNKRKRIQIFSDSEDSDSEIESVSPVEEEITEPVSSVINLEDEIEEEEVKEDKPLNKRKKRKIVDKTIMNEDGYLETKKEVVFETDSEEEVEEKRTPIKKDSSESKNTKVDKKNAASIAIKKQSSLLTFFKKN